MRQWWPRPSIRSRSPVWVARTDTGSRPAHSSTSIGPPSRSKRTSSKVTGSGMGRSVGVGSRPSAASSTACRTSTTGCGRVTVSASAPARASTPIAAELRVVFMVSSRVAASRRFFLLAFGLTWALQVPGVLAIWGILPGEPVVYLPLAMLGIFGPAVAAIAETHREGGRPAVRALLSRLSPRGMGVLDPFLALLLPGLLLSGGLALLRLAGREGPVSYLPDGPHLIAGVVISIAEELGWRGYALPRLEARYGAFGGSGVLGVFWALWHLPMLLAVGIGIGWMPAMLLFFVGGSLYFGFLMRRTGGSLFVAVLAHLGAHLNNSHAALPGDAVPFLVHTVVYAALGLFTMRGTLALRTRPA